MAYPAAKERLLPGYYANSASDVAANIVVVQGDQCCDIF